MSEETNLFDMESVAMDSPRLTAIKKHDIQTHHAGHLDDDDDPWMAIPMEAARKRLEGYICKDEPANNVAEITISFGSLLEDEGMIFYGKTKEEVESAALNYAESNP